MIGNTEVRRTFMDQGSLADILFYGAFKKMKFREGQLFPTNTDLIGFTRDCLVLKGYVEKQITLGVNSLKRAENIRFAIVDIPSAYNVILGRLTLNTFGGAVVLTPNLVMKFFDNTNWIVAIRGDQRAAKICYNIILCFGLKANHEWPQRREEASQSLKKWKEASVQVIVERPQKTTRSI